MRLLPEESLVQSEGASEETIGRVTALAPLRLPDSYLDLLRFSDDGEGLLPVHRNFQSSSRNFGLASHRAVKPFGMR